MRNTEHPLHQHRKKTQKNRINWFDILFHFVAIPCSKRHWPIRVSAAYLLKEWTQSIWSVGDRNGSADQITDPHGTNRLLPALSKLKPQEQRASNVLIGKQWKKSVRSVKLSKNSPEPMEIWTWPFFSTPPSGWMLAREVYKGFTA